MRLFHGAGALALAAALMLAATTGAQAQAFGIEAGTPLSGLTIVTDLGSNRYVVTPPSPNPNFATYEVLASAEHGVCSIWARGTPFADDARGAKARERMGLLVQALTMRYGAPTIMMDNLDARATLRAPTEWAAAIQKEERLYAGVWMDADSRKLEGLSIEVAATSASETRVDVEYHNAGRSRCAPPPTAVNATGL